MAEVDTECKIKIVIKQTLLSVNDVFVGLLFKERLLPITHWVLCCSMI